MSVSENIRALAREGLSYAEIARRLGIGYQHAYNVVRADVGRGFGRPVPKTTAAPIAPTKPRLVVGDLVAKGFVRSAQWALSGEGHLILEGALPAVAGVYVFAKDGLALYVGVATVALSKRLYFYKKPGPRQLTNLRLNATLKHELATASCIEIYTACPPDLEWNGLPINGPSGLELGLIQAYALPWNKRSAG